MHQLVHSAGDEAVVDEDVLFDVECRIIPLEIAGTIVLDAVAERQVLRPRRRADRISLHETKRIERARQRRRRGKMAPDRESAKVVERHHFTIITHGTA